MPVGPDTQDELQRLRRENARLQRLVDTLMDRVEQTTSSANSPLGFFQINAELSAQLAQQQAALRDAVQRAESASQAKSEFLANMSHEIRTPMTAILGFAECLLDDLEQARVPQHCSEACRTIVRNGEQLLQIINDILDLSKIEAGRMTSERLRCSPMQMVADVESLMRVRADAKGLTLRVQHTLPLPQTIETDPTRLRQILVNLVGNAIKFTEIGRVCIDVRYHAMTTPPAVSFEVVDTGLGLDPAQLGRLFQPFVQGDSSIRRRYGGTGLGLAISKRLAELLGGELAVESELGHGSRFRLTIPCGDLDGVPMLLESSGTPATAPGGRHAPGPSLAGLRVLLAEDGADNQRLIAYVLRRAGANVEVVENGQLAVDAALAAEAAGMPFAVVLMDMQMPVLHGYDAARLLRVRQYRRPIIALTAHAMEGDAERCLAAGCDAYQTKPINRAALIEALAQCVRAFNEANAPAACTS